MSTLSDFARSLSRSTTPRPAPKRAPTPATTPEPHIVLSREVSEAMKTGSKRQQKTLADVDVSSVPSDTIDVDASARGGRVRISSRAISQSSKKHVQRLIRHELGHVDIEKQGYPTEGDTALHHDVLKASGIASEEQGRPLGRLADLERRLRGLSGKSQTR